MGHNSPLTKYVLPAGQLVGGAVATYFGAPQIGVPLMTSGAGELIGGGAGGGKGEATGGALGGLAGMGYEGMSPSAGGGMLSPGGGMSGGMGPLSSILGGGQAPSPTGNPATPAQPNNGADLMQQSQKLLQTAQSMGLGGQQQAPPQPTPPPAPPQRPMQPPPQQASPAGGMAPSPPPPSPGGMNPQTGGSTMMDPRLRQMLGLQ